MDKETRKKEIKNSIKEFKTNFTITINEIDSIIQNRIYLFLEEGLINFINKVSDTPLTVKNKLDILLSKNVRLKLSKDILNYYNDKIDDKIINYSINLNKFNESFEQRFFKDNIVEIDAIYKNIIKDIKNIHDEIDIKYIKYHYQKLIFNIELFKKEHNKIISFMEKIKVV